MENEMLVEQKDAKTYEVGYLLTPLIPTEQVEEVAEAMYKSWISDLGGTVVFKHLPKTRVLAYPVSQLINNKRSSFKEAYFGAVKFQLSPEQVRTIKEQLEKDANVLRFLIVAVPKNAGVVKAPRNPLLRRVRPVAPVVEKGGEMSSEEIDKEIEGLLG